MRRRVIVSALAFLVMLGTSLFGIAERPTWAKKARAFPSVCREPSEYKACKPVRIPSPDGRSVVEVLYHDKQGRREALLSVTTSDGATHRIAPPWGFQDIDLLWSPDSKAFFVNGGNGGGYWGFWTYVYRLTDPQFEALNITRQARRDMLELFPPCRASGIEQGASCKNIETQVEYPNFSGIDWAGNSSAIVVMAEVPCSGLFGGIMCQVEGYELEVPSGRILKRMNAKHFKAFWQKSMAIKLELPDPPQYESANSK